MNLNMDAMDIIDYIDKSTYVILLRVYTESDTIQIPEQIDGKPVRELADHAFADEPSVLYAESEKRRAVRSGDCWTFQSAGAGASAASTHFSGERTERPDASVNAAVQNSERLSTLPPALCGRRLRAVVLPDALAAIGNYAFYGCDNLKTVSFPASIRRIGSGLFNSCPALSVLIFRQAISAAPSEDPEADPPRLRGIVLDADALRILASDEKEDSLLRKRKKEVVCILTPHLAEFADLAHVPVKEAARDRIPLMRKTAERYGCTIIGKDARTMILSDGIRQAAMITNGNSGMATAGSGDVLTGITAAMLFAAADNGRLGQNAAQLAAYVHAEAGDRLRDRFGEQAMLAGDMVGALGEVFTSLRHHSGLE